MLNDAIATQIVAGKLGLVAGTNLFVEQGKGEQFAVLKTTAVTYDPNLPIIHQASVQLLLTGYKMKEGYDLAKAALAIIEALQGNYTFGGASYFIYSVVVKGGPIVFTQERVLKHSANFTIHYRVN